MHALTKQLLKFALMLSLLTYVGCSEDDESPINDDNEVTPTGETKTYPLGSVSDPSISGTATFAELSDGSTTVTLDLIGTPDGGEHPAHIHANSAAEGGDIVVSLTPVDGASGESVTTVTATDAGDAITYDELLEYDGYINVHLSADNLATLVAQGDIGVNELTGETKTYELSERDIMGISGTATFAERVSGEALATLALEGTPEDGEHPAHIHMNTVAEGGDIAFTFMPVDGATGMSMTHVAALDDGTTFGYDDVLTYDGYINVHLSADELGTIVAQGDIGQNELTGQTKTYELETRDVDGISGTATFAERVNGEALATIALEGTPEDGEHPAHIHMNSAAEGGDIAFTFVPVDGATGMSMTNVAALDDETAFGYDDVLAYDGYINVHLSANELGTIVAQGNIGSNEEEGDTENDAINYNVTNNSTAAYVFSGNGLDGAENPNLTLKRGETYTFTIDASGHPFFIKSVQGNTNADAYPTGVTGNGATNEVVTFVVPNDAPNTLYYNCQFHTSMTGTLTITD